MGISNFKAIFILVFTGSLLLSSCTDKQDTESKDIAKSDYTNKTNNSVQKKRRNKSSQKQSDKPVIIEDSKTKSLKEFLQSPPVVRYSTPGMIRYAIKLNAPISSITWSPLAGLSVSAGSDVHNITSKGLDRWYINAGEKHTVYVANNQEIIWSQGFKTLFQVIKNGRPGWKKEWKLRPLYSGTELYLTDASNISAIDEKGSQKWLISIDKAREIDTLFQCSKGTMFHGRRGKISIAALVSPSGALVEQYELPIASILLGVSKNSLPIVWSGEESEHELFEINNRGEKIWSHKVDTLPLFQKGNKGYILAIPKATKPIRIVQLNFEGNVVYNKEIPVSGRAASLSIFDMDDDSSMIAICKDLSSPCTNKNGNRGPFNTVILKKRSKFSVMERVVQGHINITEVFDGFVVAVSRKDNETELTKKDRHGSILWTVKIPGRFSAGPYTGPYGGIYLGTCKGWNCMPPYYFISVTASKDQDKNEDPKQQQKENEHDKTK